MKSLEGKVALVAGGTRGAGRAMAVMLGEAGATVYVTGRSTRENPSPMNRPETIEETAEMVTQRGGKGIPMRVDHTVESEVQALFEKIDAEQDGQLDVLVNDVWGGDPLTDWEKPFWEHSLEDGLKMQKQAIHSHIITSNYGVPLMVKRGKGLVIEVTDGVSYDYRGNLYYSLAKISVIHLAEAMAQDLKKAGVTAVALTPGFLRSEAVLDELGVTEDNWRDGANVNPDFIASETPYFIGKAVACLASDPNVHEKTGQVLSSWGLAKEYGFTDIDGRTPDWGTFFEENIVGKAE